MRYFHLLISSFILTATINVLINPSQASLYRSTNGSTQLRIVERNTKPDNHIGSYSTSIGGQTWNGSFIAMGEGIPGRYLYEATFEDSPVGNPKIKCTGNLKMTRQAVGRSSMMSMEMIWNVLGGTQCSSIGKTFRLTLIESIPKANSKGDYTEPWGRWKVTSSDRKLNCRATANGKIIYTFNSNEEIVIDGRLGNTVTRVNGDSWMYVPYVSYPYAESNYKPCYVRANSSYVQPLSIGF